MSAEKVAVLRSLNATIIRTPTEAAYDSPESHIGVARRLEKELPNAHILDQYGNENNPLAHEFGTAEEIWTQTDGRIKAVIGGAGTGGTITGLSRGLKKHDPNVQILGADPHGSVLALPVSLNEERANQPYKVEGIGYDFIPEVLNQRAVDKWYKTSDKESFQYARRLIAEEGLLVGGSSGSAIDALAQAAKDYGFGKDDVVVVILPDSIRSYLTKVSYPYPYRACLSRVSNPSNQTYSSPTTTGSQQTTSYPPPRSPHSHHNYTPKKQKTHSTTQRSSRCD